MYEHLWLKYIVDYGVAFVLSVVSAAVFAFGIVCFMRPGLDGIPDLVSGGSSGLAQTIALALEMMGVNIEKHRNLLFSLAYIVINIPLIVLAFIGIGKRFAIFTIVNVGFVFLFLWYHVTRHRPIIDLICGCLISSTWGIFSITETAASPCA